MSTATGTDTSPAKQTQAAQILAHLTEGHRLTPGKALKLFGCARLGARVWDLRQAGHDIQSKLVRVKTRTGGHTHVKAYWIEATPPEPTPNS